MQNVSERQLFASEGEKMVRLTSKAGVSAGGPLRDDLHVCHSNSATSN